MHDWRKRVSRDRLATWDALVKSARGAIPLAGLPGGLTQPVALEAVLKVAEAKGVLRLKPAGEATDVQVAPRGALGANAVAAFATGRVEAWSEAVRAVDAVEADPDPDATFKALDAGVRAPSPVGSQPLMAPAEAEAVASRVMEVEAGVRNHQYQRSLLQPERGKVVGIAWIPVGTPPPKGFDPQNLAEWGTQAGAKGFYVPVRALPDVLMGLGVMSGSFFIAESHDGGPGPTALVLPSPGREAEYELLNTMRTGKPVEMREIITMLEQWTAPRATMVQ